MSLLGWLKDFASKVQILVLELDFLFNIVQKLFSALKNVPSILGWFFVENWKNYFLIFKFKKEKMLPLTKKRVRLLIDQNLRILNPKITQNKFVLRIDQMYIDQDFEIEAENQYLIIVSGNYEE